MMKNNFDIPILLLTFNRLEILKKTFSQIKKIKPTKLYISSDGPRNEKEFNQVNEVRIYIDTEIDWECEIVKIYHDTNLGCKNAVSKAITTFFSYEEMGIVLEDDCFPSLSFFHYCKELLALYKDDERIYSISGYNQQNYWPIKAGDYFFSKLGNCWGWASWRRCWINYDVNIADFKKFVDEDGFKNSLGKELGKIKEKMIRDGVILGKADSWALQWGYLRHKNSGLTCIPTKSLIENIGFGDLATHTKEFNPHNVSANEINFPLKENLFVVADESYDNLMFKKTNPLKRIIQKFF